MPLTTAGSSTLALPGDSSLGVSGDSSLAPRIGLLSILVAELVCLMLRFDSQRLSDTPSMWAQLLGSAPHYLRLLVSIAAVTALVGGRHLLSSLAELRQEDSARLRLAYLAVHVVALILFFRISTVVFDGDFSSLGLPAAWALGWAASGASVLVTWALALSSREAWRHAEARNRRYLLVGIPAGAAVWAAGFLSQDLWIPFAKYTFNTVAWMLGLFYHDVVSEPATLVLGTPRFQVMISPACSGYEGVGLMLAFLTVYLWLFRKDLRFPAAFALLPLGAVAAWTLNAVRIFLLIVIGNSGWPSVALGGFHTQAGWLAFNVIALGLVAMTVQTRLFAARAEPLGHHGQDSDQTTAYLAPFAAMLAAGLLTGAFSAGFDWLYPLRVLAVGAVLWMFRKTYRDLQWRLSGGAMAIGLVTFVLWVALTPAQANGNDGWPAALSAMPWYWAAAWLLVRVAGYVFTMPLAEELAFRGFLTRRIIRPDFQHVALGAFTWSSFVISSALFGGLHGGFWLAGTIAGMLFALALYRRRSLGDAVQAHATANALIVCYVFATGRWSVWS